MITAFVMLNVAPGSVKPLAEQLLAIAGVAEVYSVTGPYDLIAIVRVREHNELSELVTESIASCAGIVSTETVVAFRTFSNRDLDAVWDIGVD